MKILKQNPKGGAENSQKNVKTVSLLFLTVVFALMLCGAVSAGTPLQVNQTGTVSGDLYVNTSNPWSSTTQGATNEVTQANTLPTYTSIDSAMVYVNVYSGSGTNNWPVRTTVKLDGNGDGDYDDPGELLGVEDMNIPGTTDGTVYWLNNHCNRVYSDYQVWYDVKNLITSNNPTLYVKTENIGGADYDGRIKMLALCVAYNDGDTDKVGYWVLNGQDWINADTSPSTSTFSTSNISGQVSSAILNTVALSGTDGTYTFNTNTLTGNITETGAYYKENQWDVTSNINAGSDTNLTYANVGSSLKMNLATLTIHEATVYNGLADTTWPKYKGNSQNTGQSEYNGPQSNDVLWIYTTGGQVRSSPVIGADETIYFGSKDKKIYALNSDGTLKWTFTAGGEVTYTPTIAADGTLYFGSTDNKFYALNSDGTLKWTYNNYYLGGSAAIGTDGTIYIGGSDSNIYALNSDGTLKWTYTTGLYLNGSAAIGTDGTIYIGCMDKTLYALNPNGTLKWTYTITDANSIQSTPAIGTDGTIYFGGNSSYFYALNPDGTLKWTYATGNSKDPSIGTDGTIYIGSTNKNLYALNPDGTLKWTYTVGKQIYGSPSIGADGTIYFGSSDNNVYALNSDGTLKWTYTTGDQVRSSPVIGADGTLYVGSFDSKLYAFNSPAANFTADVTSDYAPLTVHFTDQSIRNTSWSWDFDSNGTVDSIEQNPTYIYTTPGIYTVTLTVSNAYASDSMTKTDYITAVTPPDDTEAPTVTVIPLGGIYTAATQVTLSATDNYDTNPKIYYTTDGTEPTTASTLYINPITITETTVLKFLGADKYGNIGAVQTETYTINDTEAPTVNANPVSGTYNISTQVTLSATDNVDPSPKIYYTTNGEDPTTASTLYIGPISLPEFAITTLKFIAVDKNGITSQVQTEIYNITDTEAPTVTDNREGTTVTLTATDNSDPNPQIYYTTDGTEPTTSSTPYNNSPFNIPQYATTVLKFIAVDATGNASPVQTKTYSTYTGDPWTGGRYYNGTDIQTGYYAEGNIGIITTIYGGYGWFGYSDSPLIGNASFNNLNIPAGATILTARLYQAWTWYGYKQYTLQFNGENITPFAHYTDADDGQDIFDVTPYFNATGDNIATITTGKLGANYGLVLIVVYQSENEPYRKIWLDEGFDVLYRQPATGYAIFNNVNTANVSSAQMTTITPSGGGDTGSILFNGQTSNLNGSGGSDPNFNYYDVTPALQNGTNELGVYGTSWVSLATAILMITMQPEPVAQFTANNTTGTSPLMVQFGNQSTNSTSYTWDFNNDGTVDSTDQNPIWIYNSPGTYTVKLTAIGPGGTDEETKTDYITVNKSTQPDLLATEMKVASSSYVNYSLVEVTVTNIGLKTTGFFNVALYDNGTQVGEQYTYWMASDKDRTLYFIWYPTTIGEHHLQAIIDKNDNIQESNENNNQITQLVDNRPDLTPSGLKANTLPLKYCYVTVDVTNNGEDLTEFYDITLYDNGIQIGQQRIYGLKTGETKTVTFLCKLTNSSTHNLQATTDATSTIPETDETNNTITKEL